MKIETQLIHAGEPHPRIGRAVSLPIFQTSTYEYGEESAYHDIRYARLNNTPNHLALHGKLAALEGGEDALVTGSGMAAISAALLAFLKTGDHLMVQDCLYGGTHALVTHDLAALGITCDFFDPNQPESWAAKLKPATRAIYVESISNPLLGVPDLKAVAAFAKAHKLVSLIDNTFASPLNFRPLSLGFDLSLHSCTKYLNGHSDVIAGAVIGTRERIHSVTHKLNYLGGTLDPHACFLLHRGMKTLAVRVRYQNASALELARYLSRHPGVAEVRYPGLETDPGHARAKELFDGFGGMISFRPKGGAAAALRLIELVRIPIHAPSLGGVESLITRPAASTHGSMAPHERARRGIFDDLIRLSVGLEATEDLIADLETALS